jgi:hypothetical protein
MEKFVNAPARFSVIGSLVFLILSFPLGLLYFIVTVTGLSVGLGTLVIWVGLPILFITLLCVRGMAEIERRMVSSLLHISVSYQWRPQQETGRGFLRRFGGILRDPYTWTSTIYMLLKMPLGIASFSLALTLSIVSVSLTLLPLVYLVNLFIDSILLANGLPAQSMLIPHYIEIHGNFDLLMFARTFVGVPLGIVLWIITRYVLKGLALFSGELAKALLGPGEYVPQPHQDRQYNAPVMMQGQRTNVD